MKLENISLKKLIPSEGMHLKSKTTGDIAEGIIYLGKYDSADNYEEVTEEEYQAYLKAQEEERQAELQAQEEEKPEE